MNEVKAIKETMDLVPLVAVVVQLLVKETRTDGFQPSDILKIVLSSEFREKLGDAVSGLSEVPSEIQDLSRVEAIDLVIFVLSTLRPLLVTDARAA